MESKPFVHVPLAVIKYLQVSALVLIETRHAGYCACSYAIDINELVELSELVVCNGYGHRGVQWDCQLRLVGHLFGLLSHPSSNIEMVFPTVILD